MWQLDSFIIDRMFQPVVDALANIVSCYAMAAFILTGASLFIAAASWREGHYAILAVTGLWLPVHVLRAYRLDAEKLRSVMSTERVSYALLRVCLLASQIVFEPVTVSVFLSRKSAWIVAEDFAWWGVIVGLYLMACRRPPPNQQTGFNWLTRPALPGA
jgi:hypothetical protein